MATFDCTTALSMLGHTGDFSQFIASYHGPDLIHFRGTVMAVQIAAPGSGVEDSILVQFDGLGPDSMDYVDLSTVIGCTTLARTL